MQITSFAFIALLAKSASAVSLRNQQWTSEVNEIRMIIPGIVSELSAHDLSIIKNSFTSAYTKTYAHTSQASKVDNYSFDSTETAMTLLSSTAIVTARASWQLGASDHALMEKEVTALYSDFEQNFCDTLRMSGSANFARVSGCSILSLATAGAGSDEVHVTIPGTLHESMSATDLKLFKKSLTESYHEAFLSEEAVEFEVNNVTPVILSMYDNMMEGKGMMSNINIVFAARPCAYCFDCCRCRFCRGDDDSASVELFDTHSAWEKSFCTKLANTGAANFASVHDCSIRFVHGDTPVDAQS